MKLKSLSKVDLPREKLEKYGAQKLAEHELLALLLGSGIKGLNVLELSKKILKVIKKIGLAKITLKNLLEIKGLGKAKTSQIIALLELGKRLNTENKIEVVSPEDVWKLCPDIREAKKEHFVVFYLDTQEQLIERQIISIGLLNSTLVHPREVFEPAIRYLAAQVVVAHNHPTGDPNPSTADIEITKRLVEAGKMLGIQVLNHIIVTKETHFSFKEKGLI